MENGGNNMRNYEQIKIKLNEIMDKESLNKEERWAILSDVIRELILFEIDDIYESHSKNRKK
jgi:hypothetical protein